MVVNNEKELSIGVISDIVQLNEQNLTNPLYNGTNMISTYLTEKSYTLHYDGKELFPNMLNDDVMAESKLRGLNPIFTKLYDMSWEENVKNIINNCKYLIVLLSSKRVTEVCSEIIEKSTDKYLSIYTEDGITTIQRFKEMER